MLLDTSTITGRSYNVLLQRMSCIPYLLKYPDQCSNVSIRPVDHPLLMSKCFDSVNEVDSHNKSLQSDIVLEKFWVTQCGWIRFCTNVAMGMTINNSRKCFCYGVKRDH